MNARPAFKFFNFYAKCSLLQNCPDNVGNVASTWVNTFRYEQ